MQGKQHRFNSGCILTKALLEIKKYVIDDDHDLQAGLFMALQPRIIACGNSVATFSMGVRFLTGPAVMAAASIVVGLRGVLLHVAIVQVSGHVLTLMPHTRIQFSLKRNTIMIQNNETLFSYINEK